jgi:hypothetical protein
MRLLGAEPGPLRRVLPWVVALAVLVILAGLALWGREQDAARRAAESRADVAEAQLIAAQASLTAIARTSAAQTATAAALANQPEVSLRRALDLVFAAYKDPNEGRLQALSTAFSPDALSIERVEAEHLLSGALHIAGATPYEMQVVATSPSSPDQTQIRTHEIWTYDEVDAQNRKSRCLREESDQTYTMRRVAGGWIVDDIQLSGSPRRTDC